VSTSTSETGSGRRRQFGSDAIPDHRSRLAVAAFPGARPLARGRFRSSAGGLQRPEARPGPVAWTVRGCSLSSELTRWGRESESSATHSGPAPETATNFRNTDADLNDTIRSSHLVA
jgi:hypothetical protein